MAYTVNLAECLPNKNTILVGKNEGKTARQQLALEQADDTNKPVKIIIPAGTTTISSSFLTGLLYDSIKKNDSKAEFLKKFTFDIEETNESVRNSLKHDIEEGIDYAFKTLKLADAAQRR